MLWSVSEADRDLGRFGPFLLGWVELEFFHDSEEYPNTPENGWLEY